MMVIEAHIEASGALSPYRLAIPLNEEAGGDS
jgi:hypothetical protein